MDNIPDNMYEWAKRMIDPDNPINQPIERHGKKKKVITAGEPFSPAVKGAFTMDKEVREEIERIDNNIKSLGSELNQKKVWLDDARDRLNREASRAQGTLNAVRQEMNHLNGRVEEVAARYEANMERAERVLERVDGLEMSTHGKSMERSIHKLTPIERLEMIAQDAERDATSLDSTPFTANGIGTRLGEMYAMIQGLALTIKELEER